MNYNTSNPSVLLSQYVKHYWSLDAHVPISREHVQRIIPCGLFEIIFYLNNKPQSTDPRKNINDSMVLTGQLKSFYDIKYSGSLSLFAIYFYPHGLSVFLDVPIRELFDHSVSLKEIFKDRISQLEDELFAAPSFNQKIIIAEQFLVEQISKNEKKYNYNRIKHVVNLINQSKGVLDIDHLAAKSFLSRKQFERTFSDYIGTSPKQFLKIVRFQNAIYEKSKNTNISLTELAYKCGFFDQSHMVADFKSLSGFSPKLFFESGDAFSDYFE